MARSAPGDLTPKVTREAARYPHRADDRAGGAHGKSGGQRPRARHDDREGREPAGFSRSGRGRGNAGGGIETVPAALE